MKLLKKSFFPFAFTVLLSGFSLMPELSFAEEKFLDREPNPSSYSALCQYYKQQDLPSYENLINKEDNDEHDIMATDLRGCDLSSMDFSTYGDDLHKYIFFDHSTLWPDKLLMPKNFNPEKILSSTSMTEKTNIKIRKLSKKRKSQWKGNAIGVIGKPPLAKHSEYAESIMVYKQKSLSPLANRETTESLGILAGKKLGILENVFIYYYAPLSYGKTSGARNIYPEAKSLSEMLELNSQIPSDRQMRAILMLYSNFEKASDGKKEMEKALSEAKKQGTEVFSPDDISLFEDYEILPMENTKAASAAGDTSYEMIVPNNEMQAAWLAGMYVSALNVYPDLTKDEFFILLKKTAAMPKKGKTSKKTLRPILLLNILRQMAE